jgi:hypothetical protein
MILRRKGNNGSEFDNYMEEFEEKVENYVKDLSVSNVDFLYNKSPSSVFEDFM